MVTSFQNYAEEKKLLLFWSIINTQEKMSLMHIFVVKMSLLIYLFDSGKLPGDNIFNIHHYFNIHS